MLLLEARIEVRVVVSSDGRCAAGILFGIAAAECAAFGGKNRS